MNKISYIKTPFVQGVIRTHIKDFNIITGGLIHWTFPLDDCHGFDTLPSPTLGITLHGEVDDEDELEDRPHFDIIGPTDMPNGYGAVQYNRSFHVIFTMYTFVLIYN